MMLLNSQYLLILGITFCVNNSLRFTMQIIDLYQLWGGGGHVHFKTDITEVI